MVLHTVNKSPFSHHALTECLAIAGKDDAILLLEDGVYGAITSAAAYVTPEKPGPHWYAIDVDIQERGLHSQLRKSVVVIDYDTFVELCTRHRTIHSWY